MRKLIRGAALALALAGAAFAPSGEATAAATAPSEPTEAEPTTAEKAWHYCDGRQLWTLNSDGTRTPDGGCGGGTWVEYW